MHQAGVSVKPSSTNKPSYTVHTSGTPPPSPSGEARAEPLGPRRDPEGPQETVGLVWGCGLWRGGTAVEMLRVGYRGGGGREKLTVAAEVSTGKIES